MGQESTNYTLIDRQHKLELALTVLEGASAVGVDTESSGFFTYYPELCLIQLSCNKAHYIVDTLASLDLKGLGRLFAAKRCLKIFHAAISDILELRRDLRFDFASIYDTMLASKMLGQESASLQAVVKHHLGVDLEKKHQKSNWKKRPLTTEQLDYAHLDTVYLEAVMWKQKEELERYGLLAELEEEFEFMLAHPTELPERTFDVDGWYRLPAVPDLSMRQKAILKALYEIREERARKENIAPFRLLANELLVALARREPGSVADLQSFRLHPLLLRKDAERILKVVREATDLVSMPAYHREEMDPALAQMLKRLKKWRQSVAEYRNIDTSMILSNKALLRIAELKPASPDALSALGLMTESKLRFYTKSILNTLQGRSFASSDLGDLPRRLVN